VFSGLALDRNWDGAQKIGADVFDWKLLHKEEDAKQLERWAKELERRSFLPPRLQWEEPVPVASDAVSEVALSIITPADVVFNVSGTCSEPDAAGVG
jgi:hypothetical protein